MKKYIYTIACIMILAVTLSACSSKEFPTGTYTRQNGTQEIMDDGTFTILWGDEVADEGTYSIEGDVLTWLTSSVCDQDYAGRATYQWQYEDGVLSFELIGEDHCDGRREWLSMNWFGPK